MKRFLIFTILLIFQNLGAQNITNYFPSNDPNSINGGGIYAIEQDHNGHMWYGSWTNPEGTPGLSKFDGTNWTRYTTADGLVGDNIRVLFHDSANNLWIGTTEGVTFFDYSSVTNYTTDNGLVNNYVFDIIEDDIGNIWIATSGGISKFDGTTWTNYTISDNAAITAIYTIIQDNAGNLWFGSSDSGAIKFDGTTWTNYNKDNSGLEANDVWAILQDKNNDIWFANYFGPSLTKFNGSTWANFTEADGLPSVKIRALAEDSFGDLWIGSNAGLTKFDGYELTTYTVNEGIIPGGVRSIYQDNNDDLWMGTWTDGISKIEISKIAIPDENFEQVLIELGIDTNGDTGDILRAEAEGALVINGNFPELPNGNPNPFADEDVTITNKITDLTGIESFINVTKLQFGYQALTSINLESNRQLDSLFLNDNQFAEIDISNNTKLKRFGVMRNPNIDFIDVSENKLLEDLFLHFTGISTLDVSENLNLKLLDAYNTNLTGLDLSNNTNLVRLRVRDNPSFTYLNMKNGNNKNVSFFDVRDTPLTCITADGDYVSVSPEDSGVSQLMYDRSGSTPGELLLEDCGTVYIPDANFELALINLGIDASGLQDHTILRSEAEMQSTLDINSSSIVDITGIQAFNGLTSLAFWNNDISYVDLSNNLFLESLYFNDNNISRLDLSSLSNLTFINIDRNDTEELILGNHPNLEEIISSENNIQSIDIMGCPNLRNLHLPGNQVQNLDLSNNLLLEELNCQYNQLNELNVTNNIELTNLECEGNQLKELNVTQNSKLRILGFGPNNLTEIDVSQNLLLEAIWTNGNNLSTINLDANTKLAVYGLSDNPYTSVSLKNGNNANVAYFEASGTPALDCINSDALVSVAMSSSGKTFSEDCSTSIAGRWIIAPEYGGLKVGPEPGSDLWWALNKFGDDISARACYLDDVYEFGADGSFKNILGSETWLEPFQGVASEQCGIPVAPHDGLTIASYAYSQLDGTITLNGKGAYLGLPKIVNGSELSDPNNAPNSIIYNVSFEDNGNTMILDINFGPGHFTYKLIKEEVFIPDANFEQALIDLGIDSDGVINKRILRSDAEAHTGELNVYGEGISDLTGIEAFVNIIELNVGENNITQINLSKNTELELLWVWKNGLTALDVSNNLKLERISAGGNQISNLNVTGLESLHTIIIWGNQLSSIDVSTNIGLLWLEAGTNQLSYIDLTNNSELDRLGIVGNLFTSTIDLTQNEKLTFIDASTNQLESLDLSANTELEELFLGGNKLEELDLYKNTKLTKVFVPYNLITKINVSSSPYLSRLGLDSNQLKSLDVSNNPELKFLWVRNNPDLTSLDMRNGNNEFVEKFFLSGTALSCINADANYNPLVDTEIPAEISQAMVDSGKTFSEDCGDFVYIPDENFELSLIELGIDTDGVVNTSILREDAESVLSLNLTNPNFDSSGFENPELVEVLGQIDDLTGIETFVNLTNLQLANSLINDIDVSDLVQLEELFVNRNQLTTIDITKNTNLKRFGVMYNPITDATINVSENVLLEELFLHETGISSINLSQNTNLVKLFIYNNNLTELDVQFNTNLNYIRCGWNQIANLDITNLTVIDRVEAQYNENLVLTTLGNNSLTSLNLSGIGLSNYNIYAPFFPNVQWLLLNDNNLDKFNGNNALLVENLFLKNNSIDKLILSSNLGLKQLHANNNVLSQLDVRNGNNIELTTLDVTSNLLTCINVDDPTDISLPYSSWNIDSGVILSTNCNAEAEVVLIPDSNFEQALIDGGVDQDGIGLNGSILLSDALATTELDIYLKGITSMVGIEAFENLEVLDASFNNFNEIDLTNCSKLREVNLTSNNLTNLVITSGRELTLLYAGINNLTSLNLEELTNLTNVDLSFNEFESLDASNLDQLVTFDIGNNNLSSLDMRNGNNTSIIDFRAEVNPNLNCIGVDDSNNIPAGWSKDADTAYTDSGDCIEPVVITQNITIELDRNGLATISPSEVDGGSTDNVSQSKDLTFELDITNFDCDDLGVNEVTLMVTDTAGNIANGVATVTVIDAILPSAKSIGSYIFDLNGGNVTLDASILDDGSTDNCSIASFELSQSYFTLPGIYYVDFIVTDVGGNEDIDQVQLTVTDMENSEELSVGNVTVTVYPNPFQDQITLGFSKNMDFSTVNVSLTDFNGNPTSAEFIALDQKTLQATGLSGLASGSYVLTVTKGRIFDTAIMIKN